MAPCVTPLPRVSSTTVISSDPTIRSNTARRVGIGECAHDGIDGGSLHHAYQLASTD